MKFGYPLIPLLIILVPTYFLSLAVTSRMSCSKQVFCIFRSQFFYSRSSIQFTTLPHFFHHLHRLHHCSPLKSVLTPRLKSCNYRNLQLFPSYQSCRSVDDYHALTLDPYVSFHSIIVNHSFKPSSESNPLLLSQQSDHVTPSDTVLPSNYTPPSDNMKSSDNVLPSNRNRNRNRNRNMIYYFKVYAELL